MARSNVGTYLAVAGIVALLAGLSTPATASAATLSFVPIGDAQVNSGNVNGNYGTLATIRTREGAGRRRTRRIAASSCSTSPASRVRR